ncbi:MAG: hypothetical protein WBJ62_01490 [Coriobacteriia bacterium]
MSAKSTQVEEAGTAGFLDAEAAAHQLVEALASLEVDVKGYRSAVAEMQSSAAEMGRVGEATVRLTSGLTDVGKRAAEALDVLVKIGGPEILAQLAKLTEAQQEHAKGIQELQELIRHTGSEMERLRASAQAAADSGEQNRLAIATVESEVASSRNALDDKLTELAADARSAVAAQAAVLKELSVAVSESEQRRLSEQARARSVALWSAGLAAAAALLSGIAVIQLLS